jgi:hypothetical protein
MVFKQDQGYIYVTLYVTVTACQYRNRTANEALNQPVSCRNFFGEFSGK